MQDLGQTLNEKFAGEPVGVGDAPETAESSGDVDEDDFAGWLLPNLATAEDGLPQKE
jgi:hypothetical protein